MTATESGEHPPTARSGDCYAVINYKILYDLRCL